MRGSFDSLAGAVRRLDLDPVDGHLYLFLNKRRRIATALWFDGSGWCLLAKRLEAGSFQLPAVNTAQSQVQADGATFTSILAGLDLTAARQGWYRRKDHGPSSWLARAVAAPDPVNGYPYTPESGSGVPGPIAVLEALGPQIAATDDGSVYIGGTRRIWKVFPDGTIHAVAGGGTANINYPNDILATSAYLRTKIEAIEVARDGSVYFSELENPASIIRKIDPEGFIRFVAGKPANPSTAGPSGVTTEMRLRTVWGLALTSAGELFATNNDVKGWNGLWDATGTITTPGVQSVREGAFTTVAGALRTNSFGCVDNLCGNGGPAAEATFLATAPNGGGDLSVHPSGRVILTTNRNVAHLAIEPSLPGLSVSDFMIPTADAREVDVFDGAGRHLETRDAETGLLLTEITYDEGRIASVTDWRGIPIGSPGRMTSISRTGSTVTITGPDAHETELALDANGWLESVELPGATSSQQYEMAYHSDGGLLASFKKPAGSAPSLFRYDALGRLIEDEDPMGQVIELSRVATPTGRTVTHATPSGVTKTFVVSEPGTGERLRTVTREGLTAGSSSKRPDGVTTLTRPDGTVVTRKLVPDPRWGMLAPYVASETTDPPGAILPRVVMHKRSVSSASNPLTFGTLTELTWVNPALDANGVPTTGALKTTRQYVQSTRTETITSPLLDVTTRVLDTAGRVSSFAPPDALPITFGYDVEGHMLTSTQGAGGAARTTTRTYRPDGMLGTLTDAESQLSTFDYDAAGRLVEIERPDLEVIGFGFDPSGNLDSVTPPDQLAHLFGQDDLDQVTLYDPPGASTFNTTYTFDVDRRLDSEMRPGIALDYQYNPTDGLLSAVVKSVSEKITLGYDAVGRVSTRKGPGWTSSTVPKQTLTYGYDGRLVTSEALTGDVAGTVAWTYGNRHLPANETVTAGAAQTVAFGYDAEGMLTSAGDLTIVRGDGGRVDSISNTAGGQTILELRAYDAFGALENILVTRNGLELFEETITERDKLGRIVERQESLDGGFTVDVYEYEYDLAGRLTRVWKNAVEVEEYAYDANGNRTSAQYNGGTAILASAADTQDRISTYGVYGYSYANDGSVSRRTGGAATLYPTYDAFGNLVSHRHGAVGTTRTLGHDARNRRVRQMWSSTFEGAWLWRSDLQPVAQLTSAGAIEQRYVYADAPNVPELVMVGTERWRVIKDHLGSVRLIVDTATGTELRRRTYDAFGRITTNTGTADVPFGFAGGFYRPEIQLIRFGARDYDPEIGRWTSKDPIRFGGGANLYAYANNDPVNLIDEDGLQPKECFDRCQEKWGSDYKFCRRNCEGIGGPTEDSCDLMTDAEVKQCKKKCDDRYEKEVRECAIECGRNP